MLPPLLILMKEDFLPLFYSKKQKYQYGRINKSTLANDKLYDILKLISDAMSDRTTRIFPNGMESDAMHFLIDKYHLLDKTDWYTNDYIPGQMYLLVDNHDTYIYGDIHIYDHGNFNIKSIMYWLLEKGV